MKIFGLVVVIIAASISSPGQVSVSRFEPSDCAVQVPQGEKNVQCGYLVVAENRTKRNGKTIRLPVVVLKSLSADPKPDPVLKTLGGPGGSSLKMIRGRRFSPWLADRDYIIFEQRGTQYAQPSLSCPEVNDANIASAKAHLGRQKALSDELTAARKCHDRLIASGIDLDAYNSRENAADVEDLRRALHLEKINLYGVSYSARLMLDVIRYFPGGIRSVVLESTLPPEVNYDEVGVDGIVRTLDQLFASCRADPGCSTAYPEIEKNFYSVVSSLNNKPITVNVKDPKTQADTEIVLNGDDFVTWIVDNLFSNEPSATVDAPYVIDQAAHGNFVVQFKQYAGDKLGGSQYSLGMRYSVWCSEEVPFESRSVIAAQSEKYPGLKGYRVMSVPDICRIWKVKRAAAVANQPVSSNIPALVLAAQYDAYTDPAWGRAVAGRFKNSFFFEVPWAGHGPAFSVPCVNSMVAKFLDDPSSAPPVDCLEQTKRQFRFTIRKT